ncbi:dermonecrotic toxin domain-containing protein [Luteibacter yeojuensis]|uniref:Dermonecrotic toxin N-terminal domain-containing protein n=1 Tax=Luteibacter yeojuensis TaxID=345309 RepID=A0A7X5QRF5_9GAMM|nr:DUF6543 domain-containing protein [Luteibacter yeojuensis]NID14062.1 hypothetical protein [Luteibacter yeojuensis]
MHDLPSMVRRGLAAALFATAPSLPVGATTQTSMLAQDDHNTQVNAVKPVTTSGSDPVPVEPASSFDTPAMLTSPAFAPLFVTPEEAQAYWDMLVRSYGWSPPDPRSVAGSFIKERLGIDGDEYVVAHFATTQKRMEGSADKVIVLTDALMNAFPEHSRHTFFGAFSDAVDGLNTGGAKSPTALGFLGSLFTCANAGECFSRTGRFLWSRTGPGYIYNTFVGEGNVVDTLREDARPLDLAFGIYPKSSTFLPEHCSTLLLSQVLAKFKEEGPFSELPYIRRLQAEFDRYWETAKTEWPLLARYQFVHEARRALARGVLTQKQYELVMKGGAPQVPLHGPIALSQLRNTPADISVDVRRLDVNGYAASDILRFVAKDFSEVVYIPGARSPFVAFRNGRVLRAWVVRQARSRGTLDDLLSHFSIYNLQDGTFRTGVAQGLAHLADGRWAPNGRTIDARNLRIRGDVFEDMRIQVEARLRDDARMRTSTAWDAWRTTLQRTAAVLGPVGYVPPLAIPVQTGSALFALGTGIDEGINGRTTGERRNALENAVMTVITSVAAGGALGDFASDLPAAKSSPWTLVPEIEVVPPSPSVSAMSSASEGAGQLTTGGVPLSPSLRTTPLSETPPAPSTPTPVKRVSAPVPPDPGQDSGQDPAETRIAHSMGSISSDRLSSAVPGIPSPPESSTSASESMQVPSTSGGAGFQPRRAFSPQGVGFRQPFNRIAAERQAGRLGYLVQRVPTDAAGWVRRTIDLKKSEIDEARYRLEDFRADSLTTNLAGYQLSFDHSLVFRVDSRRPRELLRGEGFGRSSEFNDLTPMLMQPSTIGSASLRASNLVFTSWQEGFSCLPCRPNFHQYAVWTERRPVATASDNHDPQLYDSILDEVHFPANVSAENIYIVDSFDPAYARALADIYQSPYVSTPYGVPLDAFEEYIAGRLDIRAANRFTERRLPGSQRSSPLPSNGSPPTPATIPSSDTPATLP